MSGITIRLTRHPDQNPLHWEMRSECPHGDMGALVICRPDVLGDRIPGLALAHRLNLECACPLDAVTVEADPPP